MLIILAQGCLAAQGSRVRRPSFGGFGRVGLIARFRGIVDLGLGLCSLGRSISFGCRARHGNKDEGIESNGTNARVKVADFDFCFGTRPRGDRRNSSNFPMYLLLLLGSISDPGQILVVEGVEIYGCIATKQSVEGISAPIHPPALQRRGILHCAFELEMYFPHRFVMARIHSIERQCIQTSHLMQWCSSQICLWGYIEDERKSSGRETGGGVRKQNYDLHKMQGKRQKIGTVSFSWQLCSSNHIRGKSWYLKRHGGGSI